MRFAVNVPNFGPYGEPATFVDLARVAESVGWDGIFVWDHLLVWDGNEVSDPWVLLAAAAVATERIRLGPMVTPLSRRRPWVVARQAVTLDHLSDGRAILGVGLGVPADVDFGWFGETEDAATRGDMLDEALAIISGLWSGEPFSFAGDHYHLHEMIFRPTPRQQPRIPIWVAGYWPHRRPFRRAANFDGAFPGDAPSGGNEPLSVEAIGEIVDYVRAHGARTPFDVSIWAPLPADEAARSAVLDSYAAAGVTWWHVFPGFEEDPAAFARRVAGGPPSIQS